MTDLQVRILLRVERATGKGKWFQAKTESEANTLSILRRNGYLTSRSRELSGPVYQSLPEVVADARRLGLLPDSPKKREPVRLRGAQGPR